MNIITSRLILKYPSLTDADKIYKYRSDPRVYKFQSWLPASIEEVTDFISGNPELDSINENEWCQLGVYLASSEELIGDIGICLLENNTTELGFTIAPEFQGNGYAFEAVSVLISHLRSEKGIIKIIAHTDPSNDASIYLLKKLDFIQSGFIKNSIKIRGEWKDDLVFYKYTIE